ncbi:MAG: type III-A CRISPR-associated RAMP protein Csm5 [Armatimonadetes bacterium]|nr:type III-A CRISPR-associated RAMP protein Csm5 [Armatimonadota bacterium]
MSWTLKVVTPVHVGSGERALRTEFEMDGPWAYRISPADWLRIVQEALQMPPERLIRPFAGAMRQLATQHGRPPSLQAIVDRMAPGRWQQVREKLLQPGFYLYRVQTTSLANCNDVRVQVKLEPDGVYIPGSSIKGALRTAIAYAYLQANDQAYGHIVVQRLIEFRQRQQQMYDDLRRAEELGNVQKVWGLKDDLARAIGRELGGLAPKSIEVAVFHGAPQQDENQKPRRDKAQSSRRPEKKDPQYSSMRHVLVADTSPRPAEECLVIGVAEVVGTVNRRSGEPIRLWQEFIKPGTEFSWCGIDLEALQQHMRPEMWDTLCSKQGYAGAQREWASSLRVLLKYLWAFSEEVLRAELRYWQKDALHCDLMQPSARQRIEQLRQPMIQGIRELMDLNSPERPLMHVGANQGFLSTTIGLLIREKSPELYAEVVVPATRGRAYPAFFPKTRRVVHLPGSGNPFCPGWVQLIPPADAIQ